MTRPEQPSVGTSSGTEDAPTAAIDTQAKQPESKQPQPTQAESTQARPPRAQAAQARPAQARPTQARADQSQPTQPQPTQLQSTRPPAQRAGAGARPESASPGGPPPWERGPGRNRGGDGGVGQGAVGQGAVGQGGPGQNGGGNGQPRRGASANGRTGGPVDAPTSQIRREDAAKDMPDLSEVRRTAPERPAAGRTPLRRTSAPGAPAAARGPRRAALQLKRIDPWSALKLSLVLSVVLFLVWMIAIGVLYLVLDGMGVWERINNTFNDFITTSDPNNAGAPLIGPGRVLGVAAVIGAVNVLLFTAIATLSSFVYNLSSDLAGGVEVTFTERD